MWAAPGRNAATLQAFFDQLTDEQKGSIRAVSIDMSAGYEKAIRAENGVPHARVCFDPFHVVAVRREALPVRAGARPRRRAVAASPVKLRTACEIPVVEPTNNAGERALRHAVIMRKTQLGTQSERGSRWIERICSVRETCRLQGRSPLAYLIQVAAATHGGSPAPSLVPP